MLCSFFFFSSRRRHTRCSRDWSSDVCSSDLSTMSCSLIGGVCTSSRLGSATTRALKCSRSHSSHGTVFWLWATFCASSTIAFRSEEHTSQLQSRLHLVCRLLLEKKKKNRSKSLITHK